MTNYLIYRHGSNAANQSMTPVMPVAIVEAASRDAATAINRSQGLEPIGEILAAVSASITVYANQWLEAVPESRAKSSDWDYLWNNPMLGSEA